MTLPRHRQLSRIYERAIETDEDARQAVHAAPGVLASALFHEAADSDDVTSVEAARAYLAERMDDLAEAVAGDAEAVTAAFEAQLRAWG